MRAVTTQLLRSVTPFIRSLARRYCRNPDLCEDVVQDVLLTVHRIRHTWDPRRPFSPWLAAIAARRGIDRIRRDSRIARFEVSDELVLETFAAPAANHDSGALRAAEAIEPLLSALPGASEAGPGGGQDPRPFGGPGRPRIGPVGRGAQGQRAPGRQGAAPAGRGQRIEGLRT